MPFLPWVFSLKPKQPIFPTSSAEYVNSLSHYYRGELARMMSWRDRLDRTTNWAITGAGAMLPMPSDRLGDAVVLRVAVRSATVLLTASAREVRVGDLAVLSYQIAP